MKEKKIFKKLLRNFLNISFVIALFALAPVALAAPSVSLVSVSSNTFNTASPVDIDITHHLVPQPCCDIKVDLFVKGPMGGVEVEKNVDTYTVFTEGDYVLTWDGKFDGMYVTPGTYNWRIVGTEIEGGMESTNQLTGSFTVTNGLAPTISGLGMTLPTFSPNNDGNQDTTTANFTLNTSATVTMIVKTPGGVEVKKLINAQVRPAGTVSAVWDGKDTGGSVVSNGTYKVAVTVSNAAGSDSKETNVQVNSSSADVAPTISGLGMTIPTFSPNADGNQDTTTASFTLNTSATVTMVVKTTGGVEVKKLINAQVSPAGTVTAVWNGKDTGGSVVSNGTYKVAVTVSNTAGSDSEETTVQVLNPSPTPPPPPSGKCAGFTDVSANDPNCDAIEYVKSIGAMTGNPDGTFDQDGKLQRDQIAKIVLETFDLYNSQTDYCKGQNPFPDVTTASWAFQYICRGVDLKMITGYLAGADAGFYRPGRDVNRIEFLALLLRNLNDTMPGNSSVSYLDVPMGEWFTGYAKYSKDHGLFAGSYLYPTNTTTRDEVARIIFELHNQGKI